MHEFLQSPTDASMQYIQVLLDGQGLYPLSHPFKTVALFRKPFPKAENQTVDTGPVSAPIGILSMGWDRLVPANPLILLGLTVRLWGFTQP